MHRYDFIFDYELFLEGASEWNFNDNCQAKITLNRIDYLLSIRGY